MPSTPSAGPARAPRRGIQVLVAARPDSMRKALLSFLMAIPGVQIAALADDAGTAEVWLHDSNADTLIIDANLGAPVVLGLLRCARAEKAELNCIVLADNRAQQRIFSDAGAGHVLLKGFLDDRLRQLLVETT